jgi:hypothetical protein
MDNQVFCTDPQIWLNDEEEYNTVKQQWDKSFRTFDNLIKTITEMNSTSTSAFTTMRDLRNKIKSEIAQISQNITNIQQVQDNLNAAQKALQQTGNQRNSFANYTTTHQISLKKRVPVNYISTVCDNHFNNDIICHENCGLEFVSHSGSNSLSCCACMDSNNICKVCGCGPLR